MPFRHLPAVGLALLPGFAFAQTAPQTDPPPARPPGLQPPDQRQRPTLAVPP